MSTRTWRDIIKKPEKKPGESLVIDFKNEKLTKAEAHPRCGFCSMPGEFACDHSGCLTALCKKHVHKVRDNDYCKAHKPLSFTMKSI